MTARARVHFNLHNITDHQSRDQYNRLYAKQLLLTARCSQSSILLRFVEDLLNKCRTTSCATDPQHVELVGFGLTSYVSETGDPYSPLDCLHSLASSRPLSASLCAAISCLARICLTCWLLRLTASWLRRTKVSLSTECKPFQDGQTAVPLSFVQLAYVCGVVSKISTPLRLVVLGNYRRMCKYFFDHWISMPLSLC